MNLINLETLALAEQCELKQPGWCSSHKNCTKQTRMAKVHLQEGGQQKEKSETLSEGNIEGEEILGN